MSIRCFFLLCLVTHTVLAFEEEKSLVFIKDRLQNRESAQTTVLSKCLALCCSPTVGKVALVGTAITSVIIVAYSSVAYANEVNALPDFNVTAIREIMEAKDACLWGQPRWYRNHGNDGYFLYHTNSNVECQFLVQMVNESASLLTDSCKKLLCIPDNRYQYCLVCQAQGSVIDSFQCDVDAYRQFKIGEIALRCTPGWLLGGAGIVITAACTVSRSTAQCCQDALGKLRTWGDCIKRAVMRRENRAAILPDLGDDFSEFKTDSDEEEDEEDEVTQSL